MLNLSLLKLYSFFVFTAFVFLSCENFQAKRIAVKAGESSWTFQEVEDYFQLRLNGDLFFGPNPDELKKQILNEIFFRVLLENWLKTHRIPVEEVKLKALEKTHFSKYNTPLNSLLDHKLYLNLHQKFREKILEEIPNPSLKEQKVFYRKNKNRFFEPERCHLKQILVKEEPLAKVLYKRVRKGESFEKISQEHSLGFHPGWVKKGSLEVLIRLVLVILGV